MNDLYEFAFDAADVRVRDHEAAHRNGYIDCPEAGGWLRPITEDEVRYGPGGRDAAIERMVAHEAEVMRKAIGQDMAWMTDQGGHHHDAMRAFMADLLDAAGGER